MRENQLKAKEFANATRKIATGSQIGGKKIATQVVRKGDVPSSAQGARRNESSMMQERHVGATNIDIPL